MLHWHWSQSRFRCRIPSKIDPVNTFFQTRQACIWNSWVRAAVSRYFPNNQTHRLGGFKLPHRQWAASFLDCWCPEKGIHLYCLLRFSGNIILRICYMFLIRAWLASVNNKTFKYISDSFQFLRHQRDVSYLKAYTDHMRPFILWTLIGNRTFQSNNFHIFTSGTAKLNNILKVLHI